MYDVEILPQYVACFGFWIGSYCCCITDDHFFLCFAFRYCPCCKKHQQAMKKLDLWRLPEVLVIHLKRFSYTQFTRNKLETIFFNVLITSKAGWFLQHEEGKGWYKFDDECVRPITEDSIKTPAAYVLFYRREWSRYSCNTSNIFSGCFAKSRSQVNNLYNSMYRFNCRQENKRPS